MWSWHKTNQDRGIVQWQSTYITHTRPWYPVLSQLSIENNKGDYCPPRVRPCEISPSTLQVLLIRVLATNSLRVCYLEIPQFSFLKDLFSRLNSWWAWFLLSIFYITYPISFWSLEFLMRNSQQFAEYSEHRMSPVISAPYMTFPPWLLFLIMWSYILQWISSSLSCLEFLDFQCVDSCRQLNVGSFWITFLIFSSPILFSCHSIASILYYCAWWCPISLLGTSFFCINFCTLLHSWRFFLLPA